MGFGGPGLSGCVFPRRSWDCQEDAVTTTVTINNLLKEYDMFCCGRFPRPIAFIPRVCKEQKCNYLNTQERFNERKIPLIHICDFDIKLLWFFFFFFFFFTQEWALIFHKNLVLKVHQNKLFDFDNYQNNHTLLWLHLFENE